ncbi:MAG: CRISPR-associated protein Cas4 [Nitrospiria bacterium]
MENDLIMISALEHYSYCPRQCALIHVEQTYDENLYTLRGQAVHRRVDEVKTEYQEGVRIERALPLWSYCFGLVGKADVVEFHGETPYPIEYKHGPQRRREHDDLQLCAQVICLEEMTGKEVPRGAIFHHSSRRCREVIFNPRLRELVGTTVHAIREMFASKTIPPPVNDKRCRHCSLQESCMPSAIALQSRLISVHNKLFQVMD